MQNHMEDVDLNAALEFPPLQYVSRTNSFETKETIEELQSLEISMFGEAEKELKLLKDALGQDRRKTDSDTQLSVTVTQIGDSWSHIAEAIKSVKTTENGLDDRSRRTRDCCDKIVDSISIFGNWLELLPSGDYGAVISGVFKMVVQGAKRAQDVRATIFEALADIPYHVGRSQQYHHLYRDQKPQALIQRTAQLCIAVLVALQHITKYFTEGTLKKTWKAISQGQDYKANLVGALERVRKLSEDIEKEAALNSQFSQKRMEDKIDRLAADLREFKRESKEQGSTRTSKSEDADRESLSKSIAKNLLLLSGFVANGLLSHLSSSPALKPRTGEASRDVDLTEVDAKIQSERNIILEKPLWLILEAYVSSDTLTSMLRPLRALSQQDLQRCLSKVTTLSLKEQDRVKWVMQSRKFQEWLAGPRSRALLLNGNGDGSPTFSPCTFLAAKFLEGLRQVQPIISLFYFCSLHMSSKEDSREDATTLAKTLVSQLLHCDVIYDTSFLTPEDLENVEQNDLSTLCVLLQRLMQQIPSRTFLFLVVDGINFYERSERRQDFLEVVKVLLAVLEECHNSVFKVLLSCHGRSSFVKDLIGNENILTVPTFVDGTRQGWSEHTFRKSLGQEISNLDKE
ncbi:MAG: hypothetical protein Q9195_005453 [Heterodermia aff. obscurata]